MKPFTEVKTFGKIMPIADWVQIIESRRKHILKISINPKERGLFGQLKGGGIQSILENVV